MPLPLVDAAGLLPAGQYLEFPKFSYIGKYASGMLGVGGSVALLFLVV